MSTAEDLNFLRFFLTEPIYLIPEKKALDTAITEKSPEPERPMEAEAPEKTPVETAEKSSEKVGEKVGKLVVPQTEGENRQGVLLLYHQQNTHTLAAEQREFLGKILKAVNLGFDDIALCNWAPLEKSFEQQKNIFEGLQQIRSDKILLFGEPPLAWSLSHFFQKYQITQDAEGRKLLLADNLLNIGKQRELKVQLWGSLQKLFQ